MKTITCRTLGEFRNAKYELDCIGARYEVIESDNAWIIKYKINNLQEYNREIAKAKRLLDESKEAK